MHVLSALLNLHGTKLATVCPTIVVCYWIYQGCYVTQEDVAYPLQVLKLFRGAGYCLLLPLIIYMFIVSGSSMQCTASLVCATAL